MDLLRMALDNKGVQQTGICQSLDEWRRFWETAEADSLVGRVRYQGGDLRMRATASPEKLTPPNFRLQPGSLGQGSGEGKRDLGADVDLVGPGDAYERWKKTPEYRRWQDETRRVLAGDRRGDERPRTQVEFRRAENEPGEGLIEATVGGTDQKVYLHKTADAHGEDIAEARAGADGGQRPALEITFTEAGAAKMAKLTEQHKGKPLVLLVDGKVISAPVVQTVFSRNALLTGDFTRETLEDLVRRINGK
jgi:hypothetical protein